MPRPERIQYEHAFYHVMNRGRGRQKIFPSAHYCDDFLLALSESHSRFDARIHSYCLMGNHYHLLIETPRANLDRIMRHINGVYTQRYNRRKNTDGPLFRGRYKAILIDEQAYFLQVGRYIHRNPAEVKGVGAEALDLHMGSSYLSYINRAPTPDWLCREKTYQMLGRRNRYQAYRNFVLQGNDLEVEKFYAKGNTASIIGDQSFRKSIWKNKAQLKVSGDLSSLLSARPGIAEIVKAVASVFQVAASTITDKQVGRQKSNLPRRMAMYCSQQLGDHSLKQIAAHFSLAHEGSVSPALRTIKDQLKKGELLEEMQALEEVLGVIK